MPPLSPAARLVPLLIASALGACGGAPGRRSDAPTPVTPRGATGDQPCDGMRFVEVRNNARTSVDVYAYRSTTGGAPLYLASVDGGAVRRIPLPEPVGYMYAEAGGRRVSGGNGANAVSFRRGCERS